MQTPKLTHKIEALQSTGDIIVQSLKEMIYEGQFKPGEPLRQDAIADLFGVSRVPVRDALNKLVAMQLALNVPRKGIVVHPLSRRLLKELFDVRIILEGAAAELILDNCTPDLVKTLFGILTAQKEAAASGDVNKSQELDDEFHRVLRSFIKNETLSEMIEANWSRIKQARCASSLVLPESGKAWMEQSIFRHERILNALEFKNHEGFRSVITENIEESYIEVISTLEHMGWLD